jgi:o-succinylbenzoate---CoA ligase
MTEASSQIATEPLDHLYTGFAPDELELLPHWTASIDATQRLILSGPALALGYLIPHSGSWQWQPLGRTFHTQDRVSLWQHGNRRFLKFLGRDTDRLKIMGELVSLSQLQSQLSALTPHAVLVPMPHARNETQLIMVHSLATAEAEALRTRYDASVRRFERVSALHPMASIPRSALGKVSLAELQQQLAQSGVPKSVPT